MFAALSEGFSGLWQSLPTPGVSASIPSTASAVSNASTFGFIGVFTTKPLTPGHACLVMGDYSIYCPSLGAFVKPEQTNIQNILPL